MADKMVEEGEKQIEIWKIKRVRISVLRRTMMGEERNSTLRRLSLFLLFSLPFSPFRQRSTKKTTQPTQQLIKGLEEARGNGTSMISLIMPPRDQISRVTKMLGDEFGTASNIKNRVNRQSVLGAITSAQQRLKLYSKVPTNGLVLYTGTVMTDDGKEKKLNIDFEPFKPINTSLYLCDNKFHTEALAELLESDSR